MKPKPTPEQRLQTQLIDLQRKRELYDKKKQIHDIRREIRPIKIPTQWTKWLMIYIQALCLSVVVYSMVEMHRLMDLSALPELIAAIATAGFSFAIYCAKSYKETQQQEIISLERDKLDLDPSDIAG